MDFDQKTTKLHSQKDKGEYLAKYSVHLFPGVEVELYHEGTNFTLPLPNDGVCMHPKILALG